MKNTFTSTGNTSTAEQHAARIIYAVKVCLVTIIAILLTILKGSCADSANVIHSKNAVFVQLAGIGNYHSINFERVFSQGNKLNYSYSVGFSPTAKSVSVPVSLNVFTTGKQHHFEMSVAVIPHMEKHTYSKTEVDVDKQMYIKPCVGYRYQQSTGRLFVKAAVGPQIFMDPPSYNVWSFTPKFIAPSAQLAVGVSF